MKKTETLEIIKRLIVMFPSFKFGDIPETISGVSVNPIEFWHQQIGDMEFDKAEKAVMNCIDKCKFVPTVADIREEYEKLISVEKKEQGDIKTSYDNARGSYPQMIEDGYAWEEWKARVSDGEKAKLFYKVIMQYISESEKAGEDVMDFKKCVQTICRDNEGKVFFK